MACDPLDDAAKHEALLSPLDLDAEPPESFHVTFETTKGNFTVLFERNLAPLGVKRVYNLVANGFYDGARFYRVLKNWVPVWGLARPGGFGCVRLHPRRSRRDSRERRGSGVERQGCCVVLLCDGRGERPVGEPYD